MSEFRMKQRVTILSSQKTDGRYNNGRIIGIELLEDAAWLGYHNEKEFMGRFTKSKYKVAYIDCFTERACIEWVYEKELEKYVK